MVSAIASALEELPDRGGLHALKVLEALRAPVLQVLESLSTRYADKLIPLMSQQSLALSASVALTRQLADAYAAGFASSADDNGDYGRLAPLLYQRSIFWAVHGMVEMLRARQRVPDELWNIAQNVLVAAGRAGQLDRQVRDSLHPEAQTSVASTYVRGLLMHLCGARSLTLREIDYTRQLAHAFERKLSFAYRSTDDDGRDSGGIVPSNDEKTKVKSVRVGRLEHRLDVSTLSNSVGGRLSALGKGEMFDSPTLSPPGTAAALRPLLGKLYGAWCSRNNLRRFPRRQRADTIFFAVEPEHMYGLLKRRPYEPPRAPKVYSHVEVANIFVDGSAAPFKDQMHTPESWRQVAATLDFWQLLEESATGLSMQRGTGAGTARVRRGQLAAIRHGAEGTAMIGEIRWAEQTGDGRLELGIEMLPGLARAGAARYTDANAITQSAGKSQSTAALILDNFKRGARIAPTAAGVPSGPSNPMGLATALPSIDEDMLNKTGANATLRRYTDQATIMLPAGWARTDNVIEFIDGPAALKLRLRAIASRHGEFERLYFEVVTGP